MIRGLGPALQNADGFARVERGFGDNLENSIASLM
jgi:hypothetical protein